MRALQEGRHPVREPARAGALHNMSAPPRSIVELRPLRAGAGAASTAARAARDGEPAGVGHGPSARFFARVCVVGLLCDGDSRQLRGRDIADFIVPGSVPDLDAALAVLRVGRLKPWYARGRVTRLMKAQDAARAMPLAARMDALDDRLAALDAAGLPPLLFAREPDLSIEAPPALAPLRAMRVLAGTSGGLFVRARRPAAGVFLTGAPGAVGIATAFDYWLPAGAAR
jgi:hypothetical protein